MSSSATVPASSVVSLWKHPTDTDRSHFLCGGVLVGPRHVLTVAHVFDNCPTLWVRPNNGELQTYPIVGNARRHPRRDAALIELEVAPAHTVVALCDRSTPFEAAKDAFRLTGSFRGQLEPAQDFRILNFDATSGLHFTNLKQPKGHSGSAVSLSGYLWGIASAHFDDPNIHRGCVLSVAQLWDGFLATVECVREPAPVSTAASDADTLESQFFDGAHELASQPTPASWLGAPPSVADKRALVGHLSRDEIDRTLKQNVGDQVPTAERLLSEWLHNSAVSTTFSVVAPTPGSRGAPPILLEDVYVQRSIEKKIDEWLARAAGRDSDGVLVAIVAPGGFGKTSLLWHQHRKQAQVANQIAILSTSTQITSLVDRGIFDQSLATVVEYARGLARVNRRLLLCMDTFDVLVHREDLLAAALRLVSNLLKAGANIILSSRPEELAQINLERLASNSVRLYLQPYDEVEFGRAVDSHCRAFYRSSNLDASEIEAQVHRLQNLVGLGRPVKEVCLNPLTLRMLFELYAPTEIPEDINSFRLYTEYWVARVLGDKRAGAQSIAFGGRNLSVVVEYLAAEMLAGGSPSISRAQLAQYFARGLIGEPDVAELLNRNLLVKSDLGTIEFFHQTFFEYSAARSLDKMVRGRVGDCIQMLRGAANDGFRLPVFEQLLLLTAESSSVTTPELEAGVKALLHESHPGLLGVGMHVHMLSQHGLRCGRDFTVEAASRRDTAVMKRFCQLIYNLRPDRASEVAQLIEAGWDDSEWAIVELMTQLFAWLAQNRWEICRSQFSERDLVATLYKAASTTVHVEQVIVSIIRHGLPEDIDWVIVTALRCVRNRRIHPTILEFLSKHVGSMSLEMARHVAESIANGVDAAPSSHEGVDLDPPSYCLAAVWDRFPTLRAARTVDDLVFEKTTGRLVLRTLARVSNPAFDALKLEVLDCILGMRVPSHAHLLLHEFLAPYMVKNNGVSSLVFARAVAFSEDLLRKVIGEPDDSQQASAAVEGALRKVASSFIKELYARGARLPSLWQILADLPMTRWLRGEGLLYLFPVALAERSSGALAALDEICADPERFPRHISVTCGALRNFPCSLDRLEMVVKLAAATEDTSLALPYLQKIEEDDEWLKFGENIATHSEVLERIVRVGMNSTKSTVRSATYTMLALLVQRGIVSPPAHAHAVRWVTHDPQPVCRTAALPLLVGATRTDSVSRTVEVLLQFGAQTEAGSINQVVDSLRSVLALPDVDLPIRITEALIEFALRPGATEPQASIIGRVVDFLCAAGNLSAANWAALNLLRSKTVRAFSATQKRTLGHHLDKPFQALYRVLASEDLRTHAAELKGLDSYLGRLVIVALCKSDRQDIASHLNAILADTAVRPELLKIIQDYRQYLWKR